MRRSPLRKRGTSDRAKSLVKLHNLWRLVLIARHGESCSASGMAGIRCGGGLQAHHIYGKGAHPRLRFDLDNGLIACRNHHLYWIETAPPNELLPWLSRTVGEPRLSRLSLRAAAAKQARNRLDLEAVRLYLEAELVRATGLRA